MKILAISNLFPPAYIGGYELGCSRVLQGLEKRGHTFQVLTSEYQAEQFKEAKETQVERLLPHPFVVQPATARPLVRLLKSAYREWQSQRAFRRSLQTFKPDVVYFWNLGGLSASLPQIALDQGVPVAFYVSDDWICRFLKEPTAWYKYTRNQPASPLRKSIKTLLASILRPLGLASVSSLPANATYQFTSRHIRDEALQAGLVAAHPAVIYWGVDPASFTPAPKPPQKTVKLLFAGQLMPHKDPATAIEALEKTISACPDLDIRLSLAGKGSDDAYLAKLRTMADAEKLRGRIAFLGPLDQEKLAQAYREHDIFLFPSRWSEPFSIALLEALSSGLAVVATATGGTPEAIHDGQNGLLFKAGDSTACANALEKLARDPSLRNQIAQAGRATVMERFALSQMIDTIEKNLLQCCSSAQARQDKTAQA